jgi:hypothetical protein
MEVDARFLCDEVIGDVESGTYNIPQGSTIRDLFDECMRLNNVTVDEEMLKWIQLLADGKPARWETKLDGVKRVHFVRSIVGG